MSVALLILTHRGLGAAILDQVQANLGTMPLPTDLIGVEPGDDPESVLDRAGATIRSLDQGQGTIVVTDLFGATPSNIAHRLDLPDHRLAIVHGLNLAMLVRAHNYADRPLEDLVQRMVEGGRRAVFAGDMPP